MNLVTSKNGINLIKKYEGCVLKAYKCPANVWTIGYGHTSGVKEGQKITKAQAEKYLKKDLVKYEKSVNKLVIVDLNQNQFDALISFTYNVGMGNLGKSTLLKKLNDNNYIGASTEFLKWNKAVVNGKKKELKGLTKRRKAEKKLFLKKSKNVK